MADDTDRLCAQWGVETGYADIWGHVHAASASTKHTILAAMGAFSPSPTGAGTASALPAAQIIARGSASPGLIATFEPGAAPTSLRWRVVLESGQIAEGDTEPARLDTDSAGRLRYRFQLPGALPLGYHDFELRGANGAVIALSRLIVVPSRCFEGDDPASRQRMFGPAVQVYALRSRRNWGIGDFTDLGTLIELAAAQGADLVGVNPLHALFPDRPHDPSPYSPSNRTMLNALYIDVEAVEEFAESDESCAYVLSASFQQRIAAARATPLVDYRLVTALKFEVLELLYRYFRARHLAGGTARGLAFRAFQEAGGTNLLQHTLFEAIQSTLNASAAAILGTPAWPPEFRDTTSAHVAEFLRAHPERVEFFQYVQWQAQLQLASVAARACGAGMAIGLYRDLAVGVNGAGSEMWHDASLFAEDIHVGAPPDEFNQKGQDWGLPPWIPQRVAQRRYDPWAAVLRANMHCAGAVRIDHVMGLMRLYWIPAQGDARDGAYVRYPLDAMFGVLALESARAGCMVVGEDLGTVPDAVRSAMARLSIMSYRVLFFEHARDGTFASPETYPKDALVTFTTHDLPTLHGFLLAADLKARDALRLFPSDEMRTRQYELRDQDRRRLHAALRDAGLLAPGQANAEEGVLVFDDALVHAVHAYLARTPSRLMTFQLEDVFGVVEQINMPSTTGDRYPNWQRKLPIDLEDWAGDGRFAAICATIRAQGRGSSSAATAASPTA